VNEKTIPFLKEHDPDLWLASDMEYEEAMYFKDSEKISTIATNTEWHEVSPKRRAKKSTPNTSPMNSPTVMNRKLAPSQEITATPEFTPQEATELDPVETPPRRTGQPNTLPKKRKNIHDNESMEIDISPAPGPQPTSTFNNVTAARPN
jgi:hypothetical protein